MTKLTLEELATLIHDRFQIDRGEIVLQATLNNLGFDSLSQVDLAVLLEKRLGIKIPDSKLPEIESISDVLAVANGAL